MTDALPKSGDHLPKDATERLPEETQDRLPQENIKLPKSGDVLTLSDHRKITIFKIPIKMRSLPNTRKDSLPKSGNHLPRSKYTLPGFNKIIPEEIESDTPESKEEADGQNESLSEEALKVAHQMEKDTRKMVESMMIPFNTPAKEKQKRDALGRFVGAYKTTPSDKVAELSHQLVEDLYRIDAQDAMPLSHRNFQ